MTDPAQKQETHNDGQRKRTPEQLAAAQERRAARAERKQRILQTEVDALNLRLAGHTYQTIADRLGYRNVGSAHRAIERAMLRMVKEPAQQLLDMELARLDVMLRSIWQAVINGDTAAIDRALKIQDRRAKYLGLDKAPKIDIGAMVAEAIAELGLGADDAAAVHSDVERYLRIGRFAPAEE